MKRNKGIRIIAMLLALLMTVTLMPSVGMSEVKADDTGKRKYNEYMQTKSMKQYEDPAYEPYGYGVDVPFYLNKQSELLFYRTSSQSKGDIDTFFDKLNKESTDDVLGGKKASAMKAPPTKLKKAYFVQAVAFDPTGSSRDDHIAFIGVYYEESKVRCYVWVYDTVKRRWTSEFNLGQFDDASCTWMEDKHITDYEAVHFLSITAGDYDGDGRDTLVAFASFNGTNGYSLLELECKYPSFTVGYYENNPKGTALRHDEYTDTLAKKNTTETRMACELDTGDLNGDGLDDLVALTYIGNYNDTDLVLETYRPIVRYAYGEKGKGRLTSRFSGEMDTWHWKEGYYWRSQVSPGMSVGDIDDDGKDEIVTAGILLLQKKKKLNDGTFISERIHKDFYTKKIFACIVGVDEEDNAVQKYWDEMDANAWTTSGFYTSEDIWNKMAVQCVAVNGAGNAKQVFIGGTLYMWNKSALQSVHTPEIFRSSDDNLTSKVSTVMFIQSTAAGNFDGNDKGYEQVAFVVSNKTDSKRSYDYMYGVVGGKDYKDATGEAKNYYSTAANQMNDDYAWPGRGKDNASGYISEYQGLNCIVVAADIDNDGVMARYKDKCLIYADPEVMCVLQAPPYFQKVKAYLTDSSSTSYKISNTYEFESSKSDSVSYGVGVVAGMESPAIQMEVTAGYALDWTSEFKEGLSKYIEVGWNAKGKDLVVVMRKPVISYSYQLQSKDGSWGDECIVISAPYQPDYQQMSIEEYNQFAAYYNKTMSKYTSDFHKLDTLNNEWLGHEGDPRGYIKWTNSKFKTDSRYKIFQDTALSFGHNSESVSWGQSTGYSVGVTESMSHGFTYDATIAMGPNVGAASVSVGLSTPLQYMSGHSTSQTQTQDKGIFCEINALEADTPEYLHPYDYNFSFKMARWPSGLKRYVNGKAEDVPVYGYALSGVTVPESEIGVSVEDQLAASDVSEEISELPSLEDVTLADEKDIKKAREEYDRLSSDAKTLVDESVLKDLENRIELLKLGGMNFEGADVVLSKTAFTYNGKVQKPKIKTVNGLELKEGTDYTVEWSNKSSKNAGKYSVTLTGKGLCCGTVTVAYKINKAANPLKIKAKTATIKYSAVKKKAQTLAVTKVITFTKKGQGTTTYAKSSGDKKITIDKKTGKVTVKKGLKKGSYKVKVKVKAAGTDNYKAAAKTVTFTVNVK